MTVQHMCCQFVRLLMGVTTAATKGSEASLSAFELKKSSCSTASLYGVLIRSRGLRCRYTLMQRVWQSLMVSEIKPGFVWLKDSNTLLLWLWSRREVDTSPDVVHNKDMSQPFNINHKSLGVSNCNTLSSWKHFCVEFTCCDWKCDSS